VLYLSASQAETRLRTGTATAAAALQSPEDLLPAFLDLFCYSYANNML